jgi:uncharacterized DUF497 family protein
VKFEWDEAKRKTNIRKHGIDFVGVEALFAGGTATVKDDRFVYGEQRYITFGMLERRVVAVVHTEETDVIRIISIRKATRNETKRYFAGIPN